MVLLGAVHALVPAASDPKGWREPQPALLVIPPLPPYHHQQIIFCLVAIIPDKVYQCHWCRLGKAVLPPTASGAAYLVSRAENQHYLRRPPSFRRLLRRAMLISGLHKRISPLWIMTGKVIGGAFDKKAMHALLATWTKRQCRVVASDIACALRTRRGVVTFFCFTLTWSFC